MKHRQSSKTPAVPTACTLLLQVIHTEWSKAARGSLLAAARNLIQKALPITLPPLPADEPTYLIHHVFYSEADSFQNPYYTPRG